MRFRNRLTKSFAWNLIISYKVYIRSHTNLPELKRQGLMNLPQCKGRNSLIQGLIIDKPNFLNVTFGVAKKRSLRISFDVAEAYMGLFEESMMELFLRKYVTAISKRLQQFLQKKPRSQISERVLNSRAVGQAERQQGRKKFFLSFGSLC